VAEPDKLLIFGASARAAAFSALRAGLRPWCCDLFADADLRARAPAMRLPARYPEGFADLIDVELAGPWMYTGGLENRPFLVGRMARRRPLWGCDQPALLVARSPFRVAAALRRAGLPRPAVWGPGDPFPNRPHRSWLVKPFAGAGGSGICFLSDLDGRRPRGADRRCYLQEYLDGESRAAAFVGDGREARLLGLTRQLVGCDWLHAGRFRYCGSIGPLRLSEPDAAGLARLGTTLASSGLRGIFGVDGVWLGGALWPVEVNPRYTASVEVMEYAAGLRALAWHAAVFQQGALPCSAVPPPRDFVGKAILFARAPLAFPAEGPWSAVLRCPPAVNELPAFADIPVAGASIPAGRPVLTFFARGATQEECEARLRETAADLDRRLFGG
jgi:predicted ATP-grasp superfamily ATP-dependent carboligase